MPAIDVFCPSCKDTFPLDHWPNGPCSASAVARGWWNSLLQNTLQDTSHSGGNLTITRLLGCPRQPLIADYFDYTFHPSDSHSPAVGTAVGEKVAEYKPEDWSSEKRVEGELFGVKVSAAMDLSFTNGHKRIICEGKFHGDFKWGRDEKYGLKPSPEHKAQVNGQRLLWNKQEGEKPTQMFVTRWAMTPERGKEMLTWEVEEWTEEELGEFRPHGMPFRVKDLAAMWANFKTNPVKENIQETCVAAGKTNNWMCKFCPKGVKSICDSMEANQKKSW